jgi:phage-related protein
VSWPTWPEGIGPSKAEPETNVRLLEATLGDGYTQTSEDGLNAIWDTYSVAWALLSKSELAVFTSFLRERAGSKPFLWTPPLETAARQWKCKTWKPQPLGGGWYSLSATFKESFDL